MSRRKSNKSLVRIKQPDAKYGSPLVGQLINMVMWDGKRQLAARIVWQALERVAASEQAKLYLDSLVVDKSEDDSGDSDEGSQGGQSTSISEHVSLLAVLKGVVEKAGPDVELVSKRLGGANVQVPVAVRAGRKTTLAFRMIIKNSRSRVSQMKSMINALAQEMIDILKGTARTLDDKEQMLRMAKANAVFQGSRRG